MTTSCGVGIDRLRAEEEVLVLLCEIDPNTSWVIHLLEVSVMNEVSRMLACAIEDIGVHLVGGYVYPQIFKSVFGNLHTALHEIYREGREELSNDMLDRAAISDLSTHESPECDSGVQVSSGNRTSEENSHYKCGNNNESIASHRNTSNQKSSSKKLGNSV